MSNQTNAPNPPRSRKSHNARAALSSSGKDGGEGGADQAVDRASQEVLRRVPPHSLEAEMAVLGGVFLREKALFDVIADMLVPSDFYLPSHQCVFAAMTDLYRRNSPLNVAVVFEFLRDASRLEEAGGAAYLAQLAEMAVSGANAEYFAGIVRDRAMQRSMIATCADIISKSFETGVEVGELLNDSARSVMKVADRTTARGMRSTGKLVDEVFATLTERANKHETVTGVSTGYVQLDRLTAGLQPSDLIIVAARPSMGKTALALNMATHAAVSANVPVAFFSLEMSSHQLLMRLLCAYGKVDLSHLRRGWLEREDWDGLYTAADAIGKAPIYIDDAAGLTPLELQARTRRLKSEAGLGLVVVDYLQLMRAGRRIDSREQEISEISRTLKALAKEHNVPVIALSQLNRDVEKRENNRPQLSDLRESGAIEQDADVIMFIYRDEVYHKNPENPRRGTAEIIVGKQRNGPTGMATLAYRAPYTSFEELDPSGGAQPSESMY
jgi:replicative DNA helicase